MNLNFRTWPKAVWYFLVMGLVAVGTLVAGIWYVTTPTGKAAVSNIVASMRGNSAETVEVATMEPVVVTEAVGAYPPPAETTPVVTEEVTQEPEVTEVPPLETPPAEETQPPAPTTVPPTPAPEIRTYEDLMKLELDKLALSPVNPHGLDPSVPYEISVAPHTYAQVFVGHGRVETPDGQIQKIEGTVMGEDGTVIAARENILRFYNPTDEVQVYKLTGFPRTGFSVWPAYYRDTVPASELLLTGAIGNPTHCGMDRGCDEGFVFDFVNDGTKTNITSKYFNMPANLEKVFTEPVVMEWMTLDAKVALETILLNNLSQPSETVYVESADGILYIGVTHGKDQALYLPEGVVVVGPDGQEVPMDSHGVAILRNSEPNTEVYQVLNLGRRGVVRWEFKLGTDGYQMAEFLASQLLTQPDAQRFGFVTADGIDAAGSSVAMLFNFSGDKTTVTENEYSK